MKISIIKMKKHPIDELFAKKLAEHRQKPSQKAFEKFQVRLHEKQTKRRGGVFAINRNWGYYAAAAGVVAALTIGVLSQRNTDDAQVAVNDRTHQGSEIVAQPTSPTNQGNSTSRTKIENEEEGNTVKQVLPTKSINDIAITKRINAPVKAPIINETVSPIEKVSTDAIALSQSEEVQTTPLQAETLTGRNTTTVGTFSDRNSSMASKIGETVVVVITPLAPGEENLTQPIVETMGTMEEKAEKEKSFLAKLYGEYKHFKYGEKVDLKRIGVKDAMAKVDEGLFKEEREDVRDFMQRKIGRMQKRE